MVAHAGREAISCVDMQTFGHMVSAALYERRFGPYFAAPVIAGLEEDGTPYLCGMDTIGAMVRVGSCLGNERDTACPEFALIPFLTSSSSLLTSRRRPRTSCCQGLRRSPCTGCARACGGQT